MIHGYYTTNKPSPSDLTPRSTNYVLASETRPSPDERGLVLLEPVKPATGRCLNLMTEPEINSEGCGLAGLSPAIEN
jgi:hypothetical protein